MAVVLDLSDDVQCYEMRETVIRKYNKIDILINCAGVIFAGDVESTFPQDYDYLVDVNLRCPMMLTKFFG